MSRIGRVTGLDRLGIEVACAVRPRGHVLQVSNGKGWSFRAAAHAALSEAAELEASESFDPTDLRWATTAEMRRRFGEEAVWSVDSWTESMEGLDLERLRLAWVAGRMLGDGATVWLPAAAVFCPPPGGFGLAPVPTRWTSNGLAAHPRRPSALRHALLELAERDSLARLLPDGWTARSVGEALLSADQVAKLSPRSARLLKRVGRASLEPYLFLWPGGARGGVSLPVAAALLFDEEGSPIPLTAGYGCGQTAKAAVESAVLEAAQSRLTDIHGAREDVRPMAKKDVDRLRSWCRAPRSSKGSGPAARPVAGTLASLLQRFERSGHGELASVDLAGGRPGLRVLRVLSRSLLLTELL